jgi:hypothetical protein
MMTRFCAYIDKVFQFRQQAATLTDARPQPVIPTKAVFATAFAMFATHRGSLNAMDLQRRFPSRLRDIVGPHVPSADTVGRVYALLDSSVLRQVLRAVHLRIKRNKMLNKTTGYVFAAVDGHEFFASRKRCCDECLTRTITVQDEEVTEYYHRGVVAHLIGQDLAIPLDMELLAPGEGEVPAAKRLLGRMFASYSRYFDAVAGDSLYFEAPFINFCLEHNKHVVVVVKGDQRVLLRHAKGLFSQMPPQEWTERRKTIQFWDEEGFTTAEGVSRPLRVLHTVETEQRRERIARKWADREVESSWYWATTFPKRLLPTREFWQAGHWRWHIENGCFNTTSTHWGLDHAYKHDPKAIVNFVLTLFLAFVLLQCFWRRNLKPPFRDLFTLIGLADELYKALGEPQCGRACSAPLARAP